MTLKSALLALMTIVGLTLAACGQVTGLPATGAASSAPNAVEQAKGGNVGGGAPANANGNVDSQTLKQQP
jgi:hypothetical protein